MVGMRGCQRICAIGSGCTIPCTTFSEMISVKSEYVSGRTPWTHSFAEPGIFPKDRICNHPNPYAQSALNPTSPHHLPSRHSPTQTKSPVANPTMISNLSPCCPGATLVVSQIACAVTFAENHMRMIGSFCFPAGST